MAMLMLCLEDAEVPAIKPFQQHYLVEHHLIPY